MTVGLAAREPVGQPELARIVDAVFACALAAAETPVPAAAPAAAGPWWRAEVGLRGAWTGRVSVACSATAAVRAASYMLDLSPELVGEADVRDALGELANVVGGGVKSLLPDCHQLSLPVVHAPAEASGPDEAPSCRLALTWAGEPFVVTVAHADVEGT